MNNEQLFDNLSRYIDISGQDKEDINSLLIQRHFKKGQLINSVGEINKYTNFIINGSIRVYYIDSNGGEHNIQLGITGWWISDFSSFITQDAGSLYLEALEKTEVLSFSYENIQILYSKIPKMERFFRLLTEKAYAAFQDRMLTSLSLDAEQRYLKFRNAYPQKDLLIPQKHIASYLGMSAEFLSKIKKRIMLKERNQLIP